MVDNDVELSDVSVSKKNKDDVLRKCMICSWEFPNEMTVKEKNTHVNYCVDGRGEEHRKHYEESKIVEKINNMPIKEEDYEFLVNELKNNLERLNRFWLFDFSSIFSLFIQS